MYHYDNAGFQRVSSPLAGYGGYGGGYGGNYGGGGGGGYGNDYGKGTEAKRAAGCDLYRSMMVPITTVNSH